EAARLRGCHRIQLTPDRSLQPGSPLAEGQLQPAGAAARRDPAAILPPEALLFQLRQRDAGRGGEIGGRERKILARPEARGGDEGRKLRITPGASPATRP